MGASDSKLVFKQGIFRLSEQKAIPADDPYWSNVSVVVGFCNLTVAYEGSNTPPIQFWELPETSDDVFSLFSATDIRRSRDNALANLETLLLVTSSRLFTLRHHPVFPDPELAPARHALNCIRILNRLLPFLYEGSSLESWEEEFFWITRRRRRRTKSRHDSETGVLFDEQTEGEDIARELPEFEDAKPLAEELIDVLLDLLFFSDFSVPKPSNGKGKVCYSIWQTGVGCNTPIASTREFESNRTEILRLLLTLSSKAMYMASGSCNILLL